MRRYSLSNIIIALLFMVVGVWVLLNNIGVLSLSFGSVFSTILALIIFIYGGYCFFRPYFNGRRPQWFWGLICSVYGGLLLLNQMHVLTFHWTDLWKLWPLVLIYIGVEALGPLKFYKGKKKKNKRWDKFSAKSYTGTSIFNFVRDASFTQPN